jgi:hypothetical protein
MSGLLPMSESKPELASPRRGELRMPWHSLGNEAEIKRIFDSIIERGTNVEVHIPGDEETFFSKFIQVLPRPGAGLKGAGGELQLALQNLSPENGNGRIRTIPEVEILFPFRRFLCKFRSSILSGNGMNPHREIRVGYPRMLEVEERRKEERLHPDSPDFLSAIFTHTNKNQETRTYDLRVLNYSGHGLGLLVKKEASALLGQLQQGDLIPEILLFGEALMTRLSAVVRHKSEISEGPYAGSFIVGLESEASLEEHFGDLGSRGESTLDGC